MEDVMDQQLNPEALKKFREKRGWTQAELAERCGFRTETVSRWERGKHPHLRANSREKLPKVLGVSWKDLTQPPSTEPDNVDVRGRVQLNVRINPSARTALDLVCMYYRLLPGDVVELAPLLFLIIAEKSLAHRRRCHDEIRERIERTYDEHSTDAPHLRADLVAGSSLPEEALSAENDSILRCDIFGKDLNLENTDYDESEDINPLLNYLKLLLSDIPDNRVDHLSNSFLRIEYRILEKLLPKITGIPGQNETEKEILANIIDGGINLKEVLASKERLSPDEYIEWLEKQSDAIKEAAGKFLENLFAKVKGDTA